MNMREKIARAIEAADCHSLGFVDRATDAVLNILNEYGEEEIKAVQAAIDSADDFSADWTGEARAAIKAFLGTLS